MFGMGTGISLQDDIIFVGANYVNSFYDYFFVNILGHVIYLRPYDTSPMTIRKPRMINRIYILGSPGSHSEYS